MRGRPRWSQRGLRLGGSAAQPPGTLRNDGRRACHPRRSSVVSWIFPRPRHLFCVAGTAVWLVWFSLVAIFSPSPWTELDVSNQAGTLKARVFLTGVEEMDIIRIQQTDRGLLSRSFVAGCISSDAFGLDELRWEGSSLIADTSSGSIAITVSNDGHAGEWHQVADATIDEQGEEQISLDAC